jgi:hypothetical protein
MITNIGKGKATISEPETVTECEKCVMAEIFRARYVTQN